MRYIQVEEEGKKALVFLSRPEIHNALNDEIMKELKDCFKKLETREDIRVIILSGRGKSFCAGADLNYMKKTATYEEKEHEEAGRLLFEMFFSIYACSKPVIARVHGAAMGGGLGLIAVCDFAFAASHVTMAFSEVKLGLVPAVISPFVLKKMGERRLKSLFLTGQKFDATQGVSWGLLDGLSPLEELDLQIEKKVNELTEAGPKALASCKKLIHHISSCSLEEAASFTTKLIADTRLSQEAQEGMRAFLEKRKPNWI